MTPLVSGSFAINTYDTRQPGQNTQCSKSNKYSLHIVWVRQSASFFTQIPSSGDCVPGKLVPERWFAWGHRAEGKKQIWLHRAHSFPDTMLPLPGSFYECRSWRAGDHHIWAGVWRAEAREQPKWESLKAGVNLEDEDRKSRFDWQGGTCGIQGKVSPQGRQADARGGAEPKFQDSSLGEMWWRTEEWGGDGKARWRASACDENWSLMQAEGGVKDEPRMRHMCENMVL